jgi:hypothetical protein
MTPATDDDALEAAFEAFLAGRRVPPAAEGLVAFADGVRATAARPPRPSAALADLLATGLLTDQSSAPAPRAVRSRRRSTRRMFLAFFAKFAAAGVAAKAAVVGGVVVVGVSTAGFTGALPDGIQHDFASVVDTATPLTAPDPGQTAPPVVDGTPPPADQAGDPSGTGTPPVTSTPTDGGTTATGGTTTTGGTTVTAPTSGGLGPVVSGKVEHGSVDGTRVSDLAHQRNDARKAGASSSAGSSPVADDEQGEDQQGDDEQGDEQESGSTSGGSTGSSASKHGGHGNG